MTATRAAEHFEVPRDVADRWMDARFSPVDGEAGDLFCVCTPGTGLWAAQRQLLLAAGHLPSPVRDTAGLRG